MTDPTYTAIMLLIDRSGSMHSIKDSAENGISDFIASQGCAEGRRTIRIAQFDSEYELVHESLDALDAPRYRLVPRGVTALLDSMARAITEFGEELAALPEQRRPGTVIFAIMTDGLENASKEYNWSEIKEMVEHQERTYSWQVIYLGANQDAVATGARLGVRHGRSMTYTASSVGTQAVLDSIDMYVTAAASGQAPEFSDEDRENATKE